MIYLNKANESWVVDRFRDEWYEYNKNISTKNIRKANILWIIAPWTWKKINKKHLKNKKVICTIHHIDTDKFDEKQKLEFQERDEFVNIYHAISEKTAKQVSKLTKKPIQTIPFWVNQNIWFDIPDKESLRSKYNLNKEDYIVGSFQRDTEGSDLLSPKLSK